MKESQEGTESKKHLERNGKIITLLGNRSLKQEEFGFLLEVCRYFLKQDLGCLMAQGHSDTITGVVVLPGVLWLVLCTDSTETWGGFHKSHQNGMPGAPRFPAGFDRSLLKLQMLSLAGLCCAHETWG